MISDFALIPKRIKGIRSILRKNNTIFALNPYSDQFMEMNILGSRIWLLIDGETSTDSIVNKIYKNYRRIKR